METKAPVRVTDDGNLEYDQWWKNGDMLLNRMGLSPKHPQSVYSLCVLHGIDPTKYGLKKYEDAVMEEFADWNRTKLITEILEMREQILMYERFV